MYEICALSAPLFCQYRHQEPRILYEGYDCCTFLYNGYKCWFVLVFGHLYLGGMAKQQTHHCVIKSVPFAIFSVRVTLQYHSEGADAEEHT